MPAASPAPDGTESNQTGTDSNQLLPPSAASATLKPPDAPKRTEAKAKGRTGVNADRDSIVMKETMLLEKVRRRVAQCGGCWDAFMQLVTPPKDWSAEREHFERTIKFLESVPLFKKQLPRCELPKVARDLSRITWKPGQVLIRQGEVGRAFFLIREGEALAVTANTETGEEVSKATLYPGDYFGGHTLITERPNVATISCKGPAPLVTLSMSRAVFESCGLNEHLSFGKRQAIAAPWRPGGGSGGGAGAETSRRSENEQRFISEAIRKNANLRALGEARLEALCDITSTAEKRELKKGEAVAKAGDLGQEFFVISSGSFDVVLPPLVSAHGGQRSAEEVMAYSSMAERLRRKQSFMQDLYRPIDVPSSRGFRGQSMLLSDPRSPGERNPSPQPDARRPKGRRHASLTYESSGAVAASTTLRQPAQFHKGDLVVCLDMEDAPKFLPARRGRQKSISTSFEGVARVVSIQPRGVVEVANESGETFMVDGELLRRYEDSQVVATFRKGDSFGELSLLYNTRREATFRAREASTVFVIGQSQLRQLLSRRGPRFDEDLALLEEVAQLAPLLRSERYELARSRLGRIAFSPGEIVLSQGNVRKARAWYVIDSGSVTVSRDDRHLGELYRSNFFGERSLLRCQAQGKGQEPVSETTIAAGKRGAVCLAFDGELIRGLLHKLFAGSAGDDDEDMVAEDTNFTKVWSSDAIEALRPSSRRCEVEREHLKQVRFLGRGGFGAVDLVRETDGEALYALKKMSKGLIKANDLCEQVCWERDLMLMVDSPFIIRLLRTYKDDQHIYFLLEAAIGGDLFRRIKNSPELFKQDQPRGSNAAFYAACITLGLEHLHERHIVYRDLKPENVLLDSRGYAKLCDMGFARFVLGKTNTLAGTPEYMAPELIAFPHTHDEKVDWWALGVLVFELIAGQTPFEDEGVHDPHEKLLSIHRSQTQGEPRYPLTCPSHVKSFIGRLLRPIPNRLGCEGGAEAVKAHGWFKRLKFDFDALQNGELNSPFQPPPLTGSGPKEDPGGLFIRYEDDGSKWDEDF